MIYCDTSLLVRALAPEQGSDAARKWVTDQPGRTLAISHWVLTEFASAMAIKERRGIVGAAQRTEIDAVWRHLVADNLSVLTVQPRHFEQGALLAGQSLLKLRGGDALHLAIARENGLALATFDHDLASAAKHFGLQVYPMPQIT